jgi:hypothetical protein
MQDNEIHLMSDWGSSGRRFKSCQLDLAEVLRSQDDAMVVDASV